MGWIKERILREYAKHGNRLDWAQILLGEEKSTNGQEMVEAAKRGDYNTIEKHCADDIIISTKLYQRCVECVLLP